MKFILVLCLLALISCSFVDGLKCLVSQPKLQELFLKVVSLVANKQFDQLLPLVVSNLAAVLDAVKACF